MTQSQKHKKTIIILIILIPLFIVMSIGVYKFKHRKFIQKEFVLKEIKKETTKKPISKKPTSQKPNPEETTIETEDLQQLEEEAEELHDLEEVINFEDINKPPSVKKELNSIYVSHTKSLLKNTDSFQGNPNLTEDQRNNLKINDLKLGLDFKNISLEHFFTGKTYYKGDNGKLESFLYISPDGRIHEYLISFDPEGNYADCLEIGLIIPGSDERKHASLSINKLSVFETESSKTIGKREEKVTEYFISVRMKFQKGKTFSKIL